MVASSFLDPALWIYQLCFAFRQQARHFFQNSIQELVFRNGLYHFTFAEDYPSTFAASQAYIGIPRFSGAIDDTAHDCDMNGSLDFGKPLLYFIGNLDDIDLDASTRGAGDKRDTTIT